MKSADFQVGQKVIVVHSRGTVHEESITTVGRKWVYLGSYRRFNPKTMRVDAGQYTPQESVYLSMDAYNEKQRLGQAWREFRDMVGFSGIPPAGVSVKTIQECARLLGFTMAASTGSRNP